MEAASWVVLAMGVGDNLMSRAVCEFGCQRGEVEVAICMGVVSPRGGI